MKKKALILCIATIIIISSVILIAYNNSKKEVTANNQKAVENKSTSIPTTKTSDASQKKEDVTVKDPVSDETTPSPTVTPTPVPEKEPTPTETPATTEPTKPAETPTPTTKPTQPAKEEPTKAPTTKPEEPKPTPKPEEPKPTPKPTPTPTPTPKPEEPTKTPGSGDKREAGNFSTVDSKLVTINKDADYDTNLGKLNKMLFNTYGLTYIPELSDNGLSGSTAKFIFDESTGRYGLKVSAWRKSYDSGIVINDVLNAILESFYFFSGDKDVAVSLWKWFDAKNINGYSNTTEFGFKDVVETKNGGTISKNGVEIDITEVNGVTTVYFH